MLENYIPALYNLVAFALLISIVVFIHEYGHFYFARLFGVRVEKFSIGFGKVIFSRVDKLGTKWQIACIPLGGYVKMYGETDTSNTPDKSKSIKHDHSFYHKALWKKMIIVIAGPIANLLSAVIILACIIYLHGITITSSVTTMDMGGNDIILQKITKHPETSKHVEQIARIQQDIENDNINVDELIDKMPLNDIGSSDRIAISVGLVDSIIYSTKFVYEFSCMILNGLKAIFMHGTGLNDIGGPLKIAQYSGNALQSGIYSFFFAVVVISINLGLLNLMPIPLLDGGHLFFYIIEFIIRRPVPQIIQKIASFIGYSILIALMTIAIKNDIFNSLFNIASM